MNLQPTRSRAARRRVQLLTGLLGVAVLGSVACASPPPHRQPSDFDTRFEGIRTVTLVPPKIAVYEMSAGDTEEEVQDWSDAAQQHVVAAVEAEVVELGRTFVPFSGARPHADLRVGGGAMSAAGRAPRRSAAEDSWLLFEAANLAIMRHAYDPWNAFPSQVSNFDYTLGAKAASLLGDTQADAFMLIIALDHIPSRQRASLVALGLGAAVMTGGYAGPSATPAKLTLALVESKSGDILWFNTLSLPFSDLRDKATDKVLVDTAMKGLGQ